jgi:beta,beta-carotene 9',10'-dioxygenase
MSTPRPSAAIGFRSLDRQGDHGQMPTAGTVPQWLAGSLFRTGPAKFEVGQQSMHHWFDGLAMLHRFDIAAGQVRYANRFLESRSYETAREQGRIAYSEFATDPCRALFKRVQSLFVRSRLPDNGNVNVGVLGRRFIAMTETPLAISFDPRTLRSAGVRYQAPGHLSSAHPHRDRTSGGWINYAIKLGPRSRYRFYRQNGQDAVPRVFAQIPVSNPSYTHSFALTERWVVLTQCPLVVNPARLALAGRPYIENYRWRPERGTKLTLIDRNTGRAEHRFMTDPFLAFHHINAFEDENEVIVDVCAYPDAGLIEDFYLDRLRASEPVAIPDVTRLRLDLSSGRIIKRPLSGQGLELPRINYARCNERPYRYVWGNSTGGDPWLDQIVKLDIATGQVHTWKEAGTYPGEPVFVPMPEDGREDDGVLLSVVLDASSARSFLLILGAGDLTELARTDLPHHIPFGFHGDFISGHEPTDGLASTVLMANSSR